MQFKYGKVQSILQQTGFEGCSVGPDPTFILKILDWLSGGEKMCVSMNAGVGVAKHVLLNDTLQFWKVQKVQGS